MRSIHELLAAEAADEHAHEGRVEHVLDAVLELLEAIGPEPDWQRRAACRGQTRVMFIEPGDSTEPAFALCAACPVFDECAAWVDANPTAHGIVAGASPRRRRTARRDAA